MITANEFLSNAIFYADDFSLEEALCCLMFDTVRDMVLLCNAG